MSPQIPDCRVQIPHTQAVGKGNLRFSTLDLQSNGGEQA